tara:strand:+ start:12 stop:521 length:510 start_codon:yes stop_codon:yes gene_type:complete
MDTTNFKGNKVNLAGSLPKVGDVAPDFTYVKSDLSEGKLSDLSNKVKVLIAVPSLDTGVCQMETRAFNSKLKERVGIEGLIISKDLPFAMKRFCESEGIENVTNASDFRYHEFSKSYGLDMTEGPLKGLHARAVFVVDQNNRITFSELVDDITHEPNYDNVMKAIDDLK